jgi:lysophospholipase L1-like esterase
MAKVDAIENPAWDWKDQQLILNQWIMNQTYHVDVTPALTDMYGQLKEELTTDGLHPDHEGKRIIGEAIGNYLLTTFPAYNLTFK